ncbi:hypothetical protein DL96DRAFT_1805286 [Flagelloscypha sp. PMI_526]|nr:hypothetical protein DL96DRAFT_1805286 [Flagelloscypha sp. PMI_526]
MVAFYFPVASIIEASLWKAVPKKGLTPQPRECQGLPSLLKKCANSNNQRAMHKILYVWISARKTCWGYVQGWSIIGFKNDSDDDDKTSTTKMKDEKKGQNTKQENSSNSAHPGGGDGSRRGMGQCQSDPTFERLIRISGSIPWTWAVKAEFGEVAEDDEDENEEAYEIVAVRMGRKSDNERCCVRSIGGAPEGKQKDVMYGEVSHKGGGRLLSLHWRMVKVDESVDDEGGKRDESQSF